jgi:hypothetical protein
VPSRPIGSDTRSDHPPHTPRPMSFEHPRTVTNVLLRRVIIGPKAPSKPQNENCWREAELLPVSVFHVVFTPPSAIGDIVYQNKGASAIMIRLPLPDSNNQRRLSVSHPHRNNHGALADRLRSARSLRSPKRPSRPPGRWIPRLLYNARSSWSSLPAHTSGSRSALAQARRRPR